MSGANVGDLAFFEEAMADNVSGPVSLAAFEQAY
jgi:hypothetical protein